MDLIKKKAIVCGSTQGIGRSTAKNWHKWVHPLSWYQEMKKNSLKF